MKKLKKTKNKKKPIRTKIKSNPVIVDNAAKKIHLRQLADENVILFMYYYDPLSGGYRHGVIKIYGILKVDENLYVPYAVHFNPLNQHLFQQQSEKEKNKLVKERIGHNHPEDHMIM